MKSIRSRLYDCVVYHSRTQPVSHRFTYRYFTFCLDLDEIEFLSRKCWVFGLGRYKTLRFVAQDSLFGGNGSDPRALKDAVAQYAKKMGVEALIARVEFVGHVRTFGYSFNPAAFYFGYDLEDRLLFGIVEVTNTYRERKAYFIKAGDDSKEIASGESRKLFYVSPFVELDSQFEFELLKPGEQLSLRIDSQKNSSTIVHAHVKGKQVILSDFRLLYFLFRFPIVTLSVMVKIHFQAACLYLKRIPYIKKTDHPELQKGGL